MKPKVAPNHEEINAKKEKFLHQQQLVDSLEQAEKSASEVEALKRMRTVEKLLQREDNRRMERTLDRRQMAPSSSPWMQPLSRPRQRRPLNSKLAGSLESIDAYQQRKGSGL